MLQTTPTPVSSWPDELSTLPVAITEKINQLPAVIERAVDAAISTRPLPTIVGRWIDDIAAENLPEARYVLHPNRVAACVENLFASRGLTATPALTWLAEDAGKLARCVCRIAGTDRVRLRIEAVDDNACSRLHIDHVVARMICTYRGPGTQLGLEASDPSEIQTVPTGMPVLLKGKLWPSQPAPKLRHRSPPIDGTDITRLILVLEGTSPEDFMPANEKLYA